MFKIHRAISASSYPSEELFQLALRGASDLVTIWSLEDPQIDKNEELKIIFIQSKRFKGQMLVIGSELTIEGTFQDLFKFGKGEVEEQLDYWIQGLFNTVYDM